MLTAKMGRSPHDLRPGAEFLPLPTAGGEPDLTAATGGRAAASKHSPGAAVKSGAL